MNSINSVVLLDKWDESMTNDNIVTELITNYDDLSKEKPIYIELNDVNYDNHEYLLSICISLSKDDATKLANSLLEMCKEGK